MIKRATVCIVIALFIAGCGASDNPKKDPMRNWGTKKSTAVPMEDFPGGPGDNGQAERKD